MLSRKHRAERQKILNQPVLRAEVGVHAGGAGHCTAHHRPDPERRAQGSGDDREWQGQEYRQGYAGCHDGVLRLSGSLQGDTRRR